MTKVVNLLKEREYDVYIGRAGMGQDGYFGNPFPMSKQTYGERKRVLELYKDYFFKKVNNDFVFRKRVLELKDKTLGCFCHPLPCHGDLIVEWLDGANVESGQND